MKAERIKKRQTGGILLKGVQTHKNKKKPSAKTQRKWKQLYKSEKDIA